MHIYFINLDRHPARRKRMEEVLHGLPFKRITAVDGTTVTGPEYRDPSQPQTRDNLSRYEMACTQSHRTVWREFLAGTESYACVLEDDVFISPDFPRFVRDLSWIPPDCQLVKLETHNHKVLLSHKTVKCLDRTGAILRSLHFGTAAYILSRRAAAALLMRTELLDLTTDRLIFGTEAIQKLYPVYQLFPALCIQAARQPNGLCFSELQSAIQPVRPAKAKTAFARLKAELTRPLFQLANWPKTLIQKRRLQARQCVVPFC